MGGNEAPTRDESGRRSRVRGIAAALAKRLMFAVVLTLFVVSVAALPGGIRRSSSSAPARFEFQSYGRFWRQTVACLARGSLGEDARGVPVADQTLPLWRRSLGLIVGSMVIGICVGIALGVHGSRQARFRGGTASLGVSLGLVAVPDFLVGMLIMCGLSLLARHGVLLRALAPNHILGPMLVLAMFPAAYISRVTTVSLDAAMQEDYVRTARAKGLTRWAVLRHALRATAGDIVAAIPGQWALLLSNVLVIEYLLFWPGAGHMLLRAALGSRYHAADPAMCIGLALFFAITYITVDIGATALHAALDPRVRGV